MVSSIASLLGSAGQAAYVAANAYTEDLMAYRRQLGLPGSHLNVGVVSDKGHAYEQGLVDSWRRKGISPITAADACEALGSLIETGSVCAGISGALSIRQQLEMTPNLVVNMMERNNLSRLRGLATLEEIQAILGSASLTRTLQQVVSPEERMCLLRQELRKFFQTRGHEVDEALPLREQGLDSLEMASLRSELFGLFGIELSTVFLTSENALLPKIAEELAQKMVAPASDVCLWESWYQLRHSPASLDQPDAVLVVFPPIACGTEVVSSWKLQIPVACATLPGWADRPDEDCVKDWGQLIDTLFRHLMAMLADNGWTSSALEFYGHSFGARVAWAVAQKLEAAPDVTLRRLCIGAWFGPLHRPQQQDPGPEPDSPDAARERLRKMKFLDPGFLDKATERQIFQIMKCIHSAWMMQLVR